eukprot:1684980-Rhodomonas_salina.1
MDRGLGRHRRQGHWPRSGRRPVRLHRHVLRPEHHGALGERAGAQAEEGLRLRHGHDGALRLHALALHRG